MDNCMFSIPAPSGGAAGCFVGEELKGFCILLNIESLPGKYKPRPRITTPHPDMCNPGLTVVVSALLQPIGETPVEGTTHGSKNPDQIRCLR